MLVAAGPGVAVALLRDENTGQSCWLGQHLRGRRPHIGGAATTPVASGKAGAQPATRGGVGALRERELGTLAGNGGVRCDRVAVASSSVPFGVKGMVLVCVRGAVSDVRLRALRIDGEDTWLAAREVVVQAVVARDSASLDHVALNSSHTCDNFRAVLRFSCPSSTPHRSGRI